MTQSLEQPSKPVSDTPTEASSPRFESKTNTPISTYSDVQYHRDDVAVIGMGCRVAGDHNSPSELWDFIMSQQSACGEMEA
jgi:6-methylsalicylic acid synthase